LTLAARRNDVGGKQRQLRRIAKEIALADGQLGKNGIARLARRFGRTK
jgi:hypothetical protein